MESIQNKFAANLQEFRKKRGLTQEELAKKLGVTFQAVSKWENAKAAPDIFLLPTIAALFDCSIDQLFSGELRDRMKPIRVDKITVGEVVFDASYFGALDMSSWSVYATKREFWRLEDTGKLFDSFPKTNQVLPYNNYPFINIEKGQVFVVDYHTRKGPVERKYYLADGTIWQNMPSTVEIIVNAGEFHSL